MLALIEDISSQAPVPLPMENVTKIDHQLNNQNYFLQSHQIH